MTRCPFRALAALAVLLAGCGTAQDGAAIVRGHLFAGTEWEASFEMVTGASVHGAGPFRILVGDFAGQGAMASARRGLEMAMPRVAPGERRIEFGEENDAAALAFSYREGFAADGASPVEGRHSDGSFAVRPTRGLLTLRLSGLRPGDTASGEFSLGFATGEWLTGSFTAALSD